MLVVYLIIFCTMNTYMYTYMYAVCSCNGITQYFVFNPNSVLGLKTSSLNGLRAEIYFVFIFVPSCMKF